MKSLPVYLFALAVLAVLVGGAGAENKLPANVKDALDKAESFDLYSLSPERLTEKPKDNLHGWKVLGKTTVKDAATRKKLLDALAKGIAENKGEVAACFNPRHGIRVVHDGKTYDLVICFECYSAQVFDGDTKLEGFLVTHSPQPAFDKVLKDANVPLPEKSKE